MVWPGMYRSGESLQRTRFTNGKVDLIIFKNILINYVPRGVVHATSTVNLQQDYGDHTQLDDVAGPSTSMHLTVGLEAGFGWTVEGFLGAGTGVMAAPANINSVNRELLRSAHKLLCRG
jgi:hypothetical protein